MPKKKVPQPDQMVIEIPNDFTPEALEKLTKMVTAKEALIKKALGAAALPIEVGAENIGFPWFVATEDGDHINAYAQFIAALCSTTKAKKRVTAKAPEGGFENEAFAMRVWLIGWGSSARSSSRRARCWAGAFRARAPGAMGLPRKSPLNPPRRPLPRPSPRRRRSPRKSPPPKKPPPSRNSAAHPRIYFSQPSRRKAALFVEESMGIFSKKKQPVKNSLSTSRPFFTGRATSEVLVNERTALQTAAVYACVRVISEAVASLPLQVYKYQGGGALLADDHPLYDLLHSSPNTEMTSFVFRETLMSHLLLYGNAYAQIIRNPLGEIKELYPLLPSKMDACRSDGGELYYTYYRERDEAKPNEKSGGTVLRREDVLHIPGLGFDGIQGYSPVALAKNAIGMAIATENFGARFFANSATPGGVLEHPATIRDPATLRYDWESLYQGAGNHRVAILEDGMKFHQLGVEPDKAQFLETRRFQLNEIARIFRVPPHMIGDLERSTFSNIEQQSLEFLKYSVDPWLKRWEQQMEKSLFTPAERKTHEIRFNTKCPFSQKMEPKEE